MSPAASVSTSSTQRSVRVCRKSTTSNSSTRVSASSTKTSARRCSRAISSSRPVDPVPSCPRPPCLLSPTVVVGPAEIHGPGEDVAGQPAEGSALGEGPGAQHDQGLGETDRGLDGDHARRLVDLGPVVSDRERPAHGGSGLLVQQDQGGGVGEGPGGGELVRGQRGGVVAAE